uniref:Reverse transcriptase domain-containing protein n=1 Tax=Tanacetum cinerariifolium TaxID=118510 RepID=A0A6L2K8H5_TANCI|nr:reverse transcriptase domain-containing protein [Tanacetum cinerariifolium]
MLRACPHYGFSELTHIDTFYNGLNEQDQDSLNAATGGNLLSKTTSEALKIIENKSKVRYSISKSNVSRVNTNSRDSASKTDNRIDKLADQISNLVKIVNKQVITPATAKAVEKTCVIYGGAHAYYDCIATDSNQPSVCAANGLNFSALPSNNVANPKGEMKVVTTRSGLAYEGPSIPTHSPLEKDKLFELAKVPLNENCSTMLLKKLLEKLGDPDKFLIPCDFSGIDLCHALADLDFEADPRVPLILGRSFLRTGRALIDVYREEINLRVNDESYNSKSSNPTLGSNPSILESDFCKKPIVKSSSPTLTPFGKSDFFLEKTEDFLNNESIPTGIENSLYDPEGDILYLEKLLNKDPFQLLPMDLKQAEETKAKSLIEEPPELELKELPSHLEYAFLEETEKLPVIILKDLKDVEKEALIKVLNSHKRAISWKIFDIKGIDPRFCITNQLFKVKDNPGVSPIHCVPKKGGMTVVANENNELIPTRLVTSWRVCDDYRKLNDATRKDHFPLPFMDQMLERLAGNEFYCFLDGFLGYFHIPIDPQDKEKTTFTCSYGTFAYRHMPFGLCNAPGHKILKSGIKVDRAKVDVIAKLPYSTTVKEAIDILKACHEGSTEGHNGANLTAKKFTRVMIKYEVTHRLATAYHPQTSGQMKVSNRGLKRILERTVEENRSSWSDKLDDALWAFCIAFKTPIGYTPYKLAYENSLIYKERTKKLHDSKIKNCIFNVGDQVLLFNSRHKIFSGKLKTRWSGPFTITQVFPYGTVELSQPNGPNFKVNDHRVKHYFRGDIPSNVVSDLYTFPMDK